MATVMGIVGVIVSLLSTACGGSLLSGGSVDLEEATGYCESSESRLEPLVVQWPASARPHLTTEANASRVMMVKLDGCEAVLLHGCSREGRYEHQRLGAPIPK